MANAPFDRRTFNPLEKPLSEDWNVQASQLDQTIRFFAASLVQDPITGNRQDGFLGAGFKVVEDSPAGLSVIVKAGLGFQNDPTDVPTDINGVVGLNDVEPYKPIVLSADHTFTVPAAPAGPNTRIDIVEVKATRLLTELLSREFLTPATGVFAAASIEKTLQWFLDNDTGTVNAPASSTAGLSYKTGVAANPGTVPATTTGYIKIAEINVGSAVVVINDADIGDFRNILSIPTVELPKYLREWIADTAVTSGSGTIGDSVLDWDYVFYGAPANAALAVLLPNNSSPDFNALDLHNFMTLRIQGGDSAADGLEVSQERRAVQDMDNLILKGIFPMALGIDASQNNGADAYCGFTQAGLDSGASTYPNDVYGVWVAKRHGTTNYELLYNDLSGLVAVDLGIAPVLDQWEIWRIEIHGRLTTLGDGVSGRIRLFRGNPGVLVHDTGPATAVVKTSTVAADHGLAGGMAHYFQAAQATPVNFAVGPFEIFQNYLALNSFGGF